MSRERMEPKAVACWHCDFSSGQRGCDRCGKCDGTGSVFHFIDGNGVSLAFPNTREGYRKAVIFKEAQRP